MLTDDARRAKNYLSRQRGAAFEQRIDQSLEYYRQKGFAAVEKTPEPMKPLRDMGQGKFLACYEKKAQADYTGRTRRFVTELYQIPKTGITTATLARRMCG